LSARIFFIGHTSIDQIKNKNGTKEQAGGAALYAAFGARTICNEVGIVTAVGDDYPFRDVFKDFESTVKFVKGSSTQFMINYDEDWNASYKSLSIGSGSKITTRDILEVLGRGAKIIHLAPMNPPKVVKMVRSIKARRGGDLLLSINSNIHYMDVKSNRKAILEAAALADIFILNDEELHALTGIEVVSSAIKAVKTKMLVLTLGEVGTIVSSPEWTEFIPALACVTKKPIDVTGAGDTWSGSFLASYSITKSWIKAVSFASVISAIKCTGWNFEKIRSLRFENVEDIYDWAVARKEKGRQLTLSDALRTRREG